MADDGKDGNSHSITPQQAQEGGQGGVDELRPDLQINHGEGKDAEFAPALNSLGGLSNEEISLLCGIGEFKPAGDDGARGAAVGKLRSEGFIEPASQPSIGAKFQLTAKAQKFLLERGAGLNEA